MATKSESESDGFICFDKSSDDEEKTIAFVASVKKVYPSDDELVLNNIEELTYDELCIKYDSLFGDTCVAKVDNIELFGRSLSCRKKMSHSN